MRNVIAKSLVAVSLLALSCVPGASPLRLIGVFPVEIGMGGECNLDSEISRTKGRLDPQGGGDYIAVLGGR